MKSNSKFVRLLVLLFMTSTLISTFIGTAPSSLAAPSAQSAAAAPAKTAKADLLDINTATIDLCIKNAIQ